MHMSEKDFARLIERCPHLVNSVPAPKKENKYRNIKVYEYEDGFVSFGEKLDAHGKILYTFDSEKEYIRWKELQLLERSKTISCLERQKTLLIQEGFIYQANTVSEKISPITYKADFSYIYNEKTYVEDVKPFDDIEGRYHFTKDFKIKWKLLKYKYPEYIFVIF